MNNLTSRIILFNKNKEILMVKDKDSDYWGLPGGGIEPLESVKEGLVREIKEEISISAPFNLKLVGVEFRKDNKDSELIFVFYGGVLSNKQIAKLKPANEIGEINFINIVKAYKLLTPSMAKRLKLILPKIRKSVVYLENGKQI